MSEAQKAALEATKAVKSGYPAAPMKEDDGTAEVSFQKITDTWKNHWILITTVTLVFAILGFLYAQFFVSPKYEASANMIVQTNTVQTVNDNVSSQYVDSARNLAKTYAQILNSSKVQNHVIQDLQLDLTAAELKKLAVAAPVTDSQIVRVTVTTEDSEVSKSIADAYLRLGPDDLNALIEAGKCSAVSGVEAKKDPIKPGMKQTIILMALIGLVLSFAYGLIRELQNHYIVTSSDVKEELGLPVLGVIPAHEID